MKFRIPTISAYSFDSWGVATDLAVAPLVKLSIFVERASPEFVKQCTVLSASLEIQVERRICLLLYSGYSKFQAPQVHVAKHQDSPGTESIPAVQFVAKVHQQSIRFQR